MAMSKNVTSWFVSVKGQFYKVVNVMNCLVAEVLVMIKEKKTCLHTYSMPQGFDSTKLQVELKCQ